MIERLGEMRKERGLRKGAERDNYREKRKRQNDNMKRRRA